MSEELTTSRLQMRLPIHIRTIGKTLSKSLLSSLKSFQNLLFFLHPLKFFRNILAVSKKPSSYSSSGFKELVFLFLITDSLLKGFLTHPRQYVSLFVLLGESCEFYHVRFCLFGSFRSYGQSLIWGKPLKHNSTESRAIQRSTPPTVSWLIQVWITSVRSTQLSYSSLKNVKLGTMFFVVAQTSKRAYIVTE